MPKLTLDVDDETYERLAADAVGERRPVDWQAEVTLRRALGLPVPHPKLSRVDADDVRESAR